MEQVFKPEDRIEIKINNNPKATGFINDLNKSQYDILQNFKNKLLKNKIVEDFSVYDDLYLLRFLRARKFDIEKSYLMITDFFKWRKKENVDEADNYVYNELFLVKKVYPHGYHKTDKLGRPIYIELIGESNIKELFKITNEDKMMRYFIREYERLMRYRFPACSKAAGRIIEQGFTILELNGVGMSLLSGKVRLIQFL